eukprot:tig00000737_g3789.t1
MASGLGSLSLHGLDDEQPVSRSASGLLPALNTSPSGEKTNRSTKSNIEWLSVSDPPPAERSSHSKRWVSAIHTPSDYTVKIKTMSELLLEKDPYEDPIKRQMSLLRSDTARSGTSMGSFRTSRTAQSLAPRSITSSAPSLREALRSEGELPAPAPAASPSPNPKPFVLHIRSVRDDTLKLQAAKSQSDMREQRPETRGPPSIADIARAGTPNSLPKPLRPPFRAVVRRAVDPREEFASRKKIPFLQHGEYKDFQERYKLRDSGSGQAVSNRPFTAAFRTLRADDFSKNLGLQVPRF